MSNFSESLTKLGDATKFLHQRWESVSSEWNDSVRREFESDYLIPLEAQLRAVHREMEHLVQVIDKVRRNIR